MWQGGIQRDYSAHPRAMEGGAERGSDFREYGHRFTALGLQRVRLHALGFLASELS